MQNTHEGHVTSDSGTAESLAAKHTPGWCWMVHPSRNEGRPIPVLLQTYEGTDWYIPLDPMDATDFLWSERDAEWQMVRDPLAETRAAVINAELLAVAVRSKAWIESVMEERGWPRERVENPPKGSHLHAINAAIAKATGAQS
jgi:hypothetical protein